jgi:cell division protein FtsI (penicillin-binding protein 3)
VSPAAPSGSSRAPRRSPRALPYSPRGLRLVRLVLAVGFVLVASRLVEVQGVSGASYARLGQAELAQTVEVVGLRGGIYDRDGAPLALSVARSLVVADDFLVRDPVSTARALGALLGQPAAALVPLLRERSGYVVLARDLGNAAATAVARRRLAGISVLPEQVRVYPDGWLARPVLGSVGADDQGLAGIEYAEDARLRGHDGLERVERSPDGIPIPGGTRVIKRVRAGKSVELTLDAVLQYDTEVALGRELAASGARWGTAVVMNVHTGAILAMANLVADPSAPPGSGPWPGVAEAPTNLATDVVYEPGSVFKIVTFSAALEAGVVTPSSVLQVPDTLSIDGAVFHDAEQHPTEPMTATQILAQSSNVGTIEIARALGTSRLAAEIAAFGVGQPTGLGFPGASPGIVDPLSHWSPTAIGSTPIGQDDALSPLQVLELVNTVASGGCYVVPRLIAAWLEPGGGMVVPPRPPARRVEPAAVAAELTSMLEEVVRAGTGVAAAVAGYSVAGKTGTAQVPNHVHGGYVPGAYVATFAGFAPAEDPALSAVVVLDRPTPIYGGSVAAPVFSEIMAAALHRYGIPASPGGGTTGGTPTLGVPSGAPGASAPAATMPPTSASVVEGP